MPHDPKSDLTGRRFSAGDRFEVDGFRFRIEMGKKVNGDLRMDLYNGQTGQWVPVRMSMLCLMFDFLWENEHHLYPPSRGNKGGEKLTAALRKAQRHGWEAARTGIESEQRMAAQRRLQQSLPL